VTSPGKVSGLHAETPLRSAAERLLEARLADVRAAEARAAKRLDPKMVHDLRVACRRLRAAVKMFGKRKLRALDRRIEHLQDALGEMRDPQLQIRWVERHGGDTRRLRARMRKAQAHLRQALALWTRRSEPGLLRSLSYVHAGGTLGGRRARKRLRKRLSQLRKALAQRDPLLPAAAHRIRIAAKKTRYEAELLRDAFDLGGALEVLSDLQTALGDLHDSDVLIAELGAEQELARAARKERSRRGTSARAALRRVSKVTAALERRL